MNKLSAKQKNVLKIDFVYNIMKKYKAYSSRVENWLLHSMKRPFYHSSATLFLSMETPLTTLTKALLTISISTIILFKIYFVPQTTRAFNLFENKNHFLKENLA